MESSQTENIYHAPPIDEEAAFGIEELFFSRTDKRGIILSGNEVFRRISQYEWPQILNKPHNIIRHPDMPKAVFYLLWDTIKKDEPIGAYVKNKAKDGSYYWVYAIVTPVEGGFLSVRIKPSDDLKPTVEALYKHINKLESVDGMKPQDSLAETVSHIQRLGFPSYQAFMTQALCTEMQNRHQKMYSRANPVLTALDNLIKHSKNSCELAKKIHTAYFSGQYVPLNLQIQAAQLEENGKTIDVIAHQYSILSQEIKGNIESFLKNAEHVYENVNQSVFLVCTSLVQQEVYQAFSEEDEHDGADKDAEMESLFSQQQHYQKQSASQLRDMSAQADVFKNDCQDMKRLSAGLEVARMMGKMESARLTQHDNVLNELINDLDEFQQTTATGLRELDKVNIAINDCIQRVQAAK